MQETDTHYTVLARRFRPQIFSEVVGQQRVATALRNAIDGGRVAHAYLFTGARGVGKTSMARILAKALNCPDAQQGDPCNQCDICNGISGGNDIDVLEIDGASNRGIDDIRALRGNVNVKSMRTVHKIYIIDEVHMLTKEAFNALLKTLEEPPPNVKFIFCTTEPNKLPDTILSRCQRFDFASIETASIISRLHQIAEAEGFEVEPAALEVVARRAAGSMRDSQSLFDQLLAFGEDRITPDDVHRLLGTASDDRLIEIIDSLIDHDRARMLELFDVALADGVQLGELIDQLIGYFRDLIVVESGAEKVPLLAVAEQNRGTLADQANRWGLQTLMAAMQILGEAKTRMFRVSFDRALAELALTRIAILEDLKQLDLLIQDLKQGTTQSGELPKPPARQPSSEVASSAAPPASPSTAAHAPVDPEKKTEIVSDEPVEANTEPDSPIEHVAFQAGSERALWSQVVSHIDDMLKDHAKVVSDLAISGPNQLDLMFPRSYHFSKQYCERPEICSRLEALAAQVAGQPVRLAFRLIETETESNSAVDSPAEPETSTTKPGELTCDEFVEQAKSVFGAELIRADRIQPPPSQQE